MALVRLLPRAIQFSLKHWENVLFELWSARVKPWPRSIPVQQKPGQKPGQPGKAWWGQAYQAPSQSFRASPAKETLESLQHVKCNIVACNMLCSFGHHVVHKFTKIKLVPEWQEARCSAPSEHQRKPRVERVADLCIQSQLRHRWTVGQLQLMFQAY